MSAPQGIKDAVLRALDAAYESDSLAAERVELELNDAIAYEEGAAAPTSATFKVLVDASDARTITIRITSRSSPAAWPR